MAEKAQKAQSRWVRRRYGLVCGVLIALVFGWGIFSTWATRDQSFGTGDDATYYALARELAHGQVIWKDFVHFKTPGASFLEAGTIKVFGDSQKSVVLGIRAEINVLYPVVFLTGVYLLFRRSRNPLYFVIGALAMFFLPPIVGLRAGFAFLSLCIYLMSYDYKERKRDWLLLAAGAATGVAFMFGQDMMLVSATALASGEIFRRHEAGALKRLRWLIGGAFLGAAPLLLYVILLSNIGTFLYYIGYYGLFLQPRYMNSPFPDFAYSSLLFYLPFILYFICFLQLTWDRRSNSRDALLLSFGILRLVSALGRSDVGHLLFSIPELFIIVPYFLLRTQSMQTDRQRIRQVWPYAAALLIIFTIAITKTSLILLIVPLLCLYALRPVAAAGRVKLAPQLLRTNLYALIGALAVLVVFLLFPAAYGNIRSVKQGAVTGPGPYTIDGLIADPVTYQEVSQATQAIDQYHPQTIFSFPIQAYYYSLAPHMATRFVTFEPETTIKEQDEAIADLQRTKPQVVLMDVLQAQGLSASVWKISGYIQNHYKVVKTISDNDIFWVMVPRTDNVQSHSLVFQLLKDNPNTPAEGFHMPKQNIDSALYQPAHETVGFSVDNNSPVTLQIGVLVSQYIETGQTATCGTVTVHWANVTHHVNLCSAQGSQTIPLGKDATVTFTNNSSKDLTWSDPQIVSAN